MKTSQSSYIEKEQKLKAKLAKVRAEKKRADKRAKAHAQREQNRKDIEIGALVRKAALTNPEAAALLKLLGFPPASPSPTPTVTES